MQRLCLLCLALQGNSPFTQAQDSLKLLSGRNLKSELESAVSRIEAGLVDSEGLASLYSGIPKICKVQKLINCAIDYSQAVGQREQSSIDDKECIPFASAEQDATPSVSTNTIVIRD